MSNTKMADDYLAFLSQQAGISEEPAKEPINLKEEGIGELTHNSAIKEINYLTTNLHELYSKNKNNPIVINSIVKLVELKTKLLGMYSVKPDMRELIEVETENYKRAVLEVLNEFVPIQMELIVNKLTERGL